MNKIHIEKGSIQETLVLPLYARKLCTEQFPTLYRDEYATKICKSIDYDFSQFKSKEKSVMYQFGALEVAMREKDKWTVLTMNIENGGKIKVDFEYENVDENLIEYEKNSRIFKYCEI